MNTAEQAFAIIRSLNDLETQILHLMNERDALRAALLAIRDHITPATAYPETVAWVQATVDGMAKP